MTNDLEAVLENCWVDGTRPDKPEVRQFCRWCHHGSPGEHDPECPCPALSLALQQRDALAGYIKAEKRNLTMQGAVRLAKSPAKAKVKRRLDETALVLQTALARLHELGIEEMVR